MTAGGKRMNVFIIVGICIILGVFGQLSMKKGLNHIGVVPVKELFSEKLFSVVFQKYVFIGITLYGMASVLWLAALSMEEVSYIYPLIGIGYVLTAILAWVFFGEKVTALRFLGIVLIATGAYLVIIKELPFWLK